MAAGSGFGSFAGFRAGLSIDMHSDGDSSLLSDDQDGRRIGAIAVVFQVGGATTAYWFVSPSESQYL